MSGTYTLSAERDEVINIFKNAANVLADLVFWQNIAGKRIVLHSLLVSNTESDFTIGTISLSDFIQDEFIYFYLPIDKAIFKVRNNSSSQEKIIFALPEEIKILEGAAAAEMDQYIDFFQRDVHKVHTGTDKIKDELHIIKGERQKAQMLKGFVAGTDHTGSKNLSGRLQGTDTKNDILQGHTDFDRDLFEQELGFMSLDEEEKQFEGMRTAPRSRAKEGKFVNLTIEGNTELLEATYPLFDLSRGGFAFVVLEETLFNKGDFILIQALNTNRFENPLYGEVMSVRAIDQMGVEYKVGCRFVPKEEN